MAKVYIAGPFFKSYWLRMGTDVNGRLVQSSHKTEAEALEGKKEGDELFFVNEVEVVDKIKEILDSKGIEYFSPKDESLITPKSTKQDMINTFKQNIESIDKCDYMISIVEGGDTGTMVEFGYALAKRIPILGFSSVPMRKLNLMLSEACIGYAGGYGELSEKLDNIDALIANKEPFVGEVE